MEFVYKDKTITFNKELNDLDKLALNFSSILEKLQIKNVCISGYVAILFGRSRSSEDIDFITEPLSRERFNALWNSLEKELFECINTSDEREAFDYYINARHALRFAKNGKIEPNIEIKFPKQELDTTALEKQINVEVKGYKINISPLELQISFKLYLGSEKDIKDAALSGVRK